MNKFEKALFYLISLTLLGFLSVVVFLLYYPFTVVELVDSPISVLKKDIKAGEILEYRFHIIKHRNIRAEISRDLYCNGDAIANTSGLSSYPVGESNTINYFMIPSYTPAGVCKIEFTLKYHLYGIREITYSFSSEEFVVSSNENENGTSVTAPRSTLIQVPTMIPISTPIIEETTIKETKNTTTTSNTTTQTPATIKEDGGIISEIKKALF